MGKRCLSTIIIVVTLAVAFVSISEAVDAEDAPDEIHYCYGDSIQLHYAHTDGAELSWTVHLLSSSGTETRSFGNEESITIDSVQGLDLIRATLTATLGGVSDTKTYEIHPVPISEDDDDADGVYTIRFLDGSKIVGSTTINGHCSFEYGEDSFFEVPDTPEKDGYTFLGWYTIDDSGREVRLGEGDHMEPVYSDIDYYAKWVDNGTGSGGGSGGTVVVEETHLVTFQADPGLYCTVNSSGKGFVNFTVSVYEGFYYEGVHVVSDVGTISGSGMVYTLTGIDSDVVVTVTGDRMYKVTYHVPKGTTVSTSEYGDNPELVSEGPLLMTVEGSDNMEIFVFMGSMDVTGECVRGDVIFIGDVTGDVFVLVNDTTPVAPGAGSDDRFPWWIIVIMFVAVIAILLVYIVLRHRS